jgi:hypothetical protein
MAIPVQRFVDQLAVDHHVLVIGGLAVIGHGYSRPTKDADLWLEPMASSQDWANAVEAVCRSIPGTSIHRLPGWVEVSGPELSDAVDETGVVRIMGLNSPLDIFRSPNEFKPEHFDLVASRAKLNADGTLLPEPLDLIQTKIDTGRDQDLKDIDYLESVVRAEYAERLPAATLDEARGMLERYSEWRVLQAALTNPCEEVRELATSHLNEFAEAGDPFSQAILAGREIP